MARQDPCKPTTTSLHVNVVDVLALGVLAEFPDRQCVELQRLSIRAAAVDESREVEPAVHGDVSAGRAAVSGVAVDVQQHPARAHRQGRAGWVRGGAGADDARHRCW